MPEDFLLIVYKYKLCGRGTAVYTQICIARICGDILKFNRFLAVTVFKLF